MGGFQEEIGDHLEAMSLALVTMEGEDIPTLGEILNRLSDLQRIASDAGQAQLGLLVDALAKYLEKVVLREVCDLSPFEKGLEQLQSLHHCLVNQVESKDDLRPVLTLLTGSADQAASPDRDCPPLEDSVESADAPQVRIAEVAQPSELFSSPDAAMDDEDRDIVNGFITESLEGLETVEVRLIDLEQDSTDPESINAIFRAFHTIKGVSSFLGFMRINRLAHRSENLLEKLRSGELEVDAGIIDVVLSAVDLLKKMIHGVQTGMQSGAPLDIGLDIAPLVARIEAVQTASSDFVKPVGEILVESGTLSRQDLAEALDIQKSLPEKKIGRILIEQGAVDAVQISAALREQKKSGAQKIDPQVKVDTHKLDNLVDLAGELVIAQSMLRQHPFLQGAKDQQLLHTLSQLNQITSSLQSMTMSLRMVPIRNTFQKMLRLVRDLGKTSGKKVQLLMSGEETEIDRNVVDELYEPMVHMIRNSVDHGLESPGERCAAGKSDTGTIQLKAFHRGGHIIVEISDDGRGLNRDRIVEKARANNLIDDSVRLDDEDIYNLIFQPGFSTAQTVTDISGRGVGMDVVKKAIEGLRGRVDIRTEPGQGTTFCISLPLTLAIIEGMLVRVGRQRFVIPALAIIESFRPSREQCYTVEKKGEMVLSRGKLIPLVRLERIFKTCCDACTPWEGLIVTVEYDGNRMGILLDELLGKEEVVIKSLGEALKHVQGIAGGAILGDGQVGLILDMAGIWALAMAC